MQIIPEFKIGILNAWIFAACYFLIPFLLMLINKKAYNKAGTPSGMNKKEKVIANIDNIIIYAAIWGEPLLLDRILTYRYNS